MLEHFSVQVMSTPSLAGSTPSAAWGSEPASSQGPKKKWISDMDKRAMWTECGDLTMPAKETRCIDEFRQLKKDIERLSGK